MGGGGLGGGASTKHEECCQKLPKSLDAMFAGHPFITQYT